MCVKQVLDPELPAEEFRLDPVTQRPNVEHAKWVMGTFDEIAVEVALQLLERAAEGSVTALTVGPPSADEVLRKAVAVGARDALRVDVPEEEELDGVQTATLLAAAVRESLGPAEVVLCGRQASDTDAGQVGPLLAEMLGVAMVSNVLVVEPAGRGKLRAERETDEGTEVLEVSLPALFTVTNGECNVPRLPKVRDLLAAQRRQIPAVPASQLVGENPAWMKVDSMELPQTARECRMVEGETAEEKVDALLRALRELQVV